MFSTVGEYTTFLADAARCVNRLHATKSDAALYCGPYLSGMRERLIPDAAAATRLLRFSTSTATALATPQAEKMGLREAAWVAVCADLKARVLL